MTYLAEGLPVPVAEDDGLDAPYWDGARQHRLMIQRCTKCGTFQWGPEWLCHNCLSFRDRLVETEPTGRIYSWERVWHPTHPALKDQGPYLVTTRRVASRRKCPNDRQPPWRSNAGSPIRLRLLQPILKITSARLTPIPRAVEACKNLICACAAQQQSGCSHGGGNGLFMALLGAWLCSRPA